MLLTKDSIAFVEGDNYINLFLNIINRHGFIAGSTGSGKTITLRKLSEIFSLNNIPVFLVDIKGDISGLINPGKKQGIVAQKMAQFKLSDSYLQGFPVRFWDIFGEKGIPLKVSVENLGVVFLSRLLDLNSTQEGVLNLAFKISKDKHLKLVSIEDLRNLLKYLSENYKDYQNFYGNVSIATIGTIQRQLLVFENEGSDIFFGNPSLDIMDFFSNKNSKGVINILNGEKLINYPRAFSSFLLWMLVKLFEVLPEVGDLDKPKFVILFDEAHLLFDKAQDVLVNQIEKVVRLIRSKSVGIFFCTQNPLDIPSSILSQLGNKIQHSLRSFTINEQKTIKSIAQTFRSNKNVNNLVESIGSLETGQVLISFLDEKAVPNIVQKAYILPPASDISILSKDSLLDIVTKDELYYKYSKLDIGDLSSDQLLKADNSSYNKNDNKNNTISILDGFFRGFLGFRKKSNKSVVYDLSNNLGKSTSKKLSRYIKKILSKRR